jgi:hypothetical protein
MEKNKGYQQFPALNPIPVPFQQSECGVRTSKFSISREIKHGLCGVFKKTPGYKWKRAQVFLKRKRNKDEFEPKQGQINGHKKLEDSGYIDLYYGDESHF